MWANKDFLDLIRAKTISRHHYRRCPSCLLWVDNRNARRHLRACRRKDSK